MVGIILAIGILIFGIFLKLTKNPGFQASKKYAWLFIILGITTLVGKIIIQYLQK